MKRQKLTIPLGESMKDQQDLMDTPIENTSEEWEERFEKEFCRKDLSSEDRGFMDGWFLKDGITGKDIKAFIEKEKEKSKLEGLDMAIGDKETAIYGNGTEPKEYFEKFKNVNLGYNKKRQEIINLKNNTKDLLL